MPSRRGRARPVAPAADPAPRPDERGRIAFADALLVYEAVGAGPPVVLVHGLAGSSRWWERNVGALTGRFRVYVVDLVGFGRSRGGVWRPHRFDLSRAAPHLVTMLDEFGIARASFVGHSMGGLIAAGLAADFPERVERLVLVDAALLTFDPGLRRRAVGLARALHRSPADLLPLLARDALRAGAGTLGVATLQLLRADWRTKLERIRAPTLVVWGEGDSIVPVSIGREIARHVAGARLVMLPRCGHNPMWEAPAAFNDLVVRYLSTGEVDFEPRAD